MSSAGITKGVRLVHPGRNANRWLLNLRVPRPSAGSLVSLLISMCSNCPPGLVALAPWFLSLDRFARLLFFKGPEHDFCLQGSPTGGNLVRVQFAVNEISLGFGSKSLFYP
jgi:hypothetical protein